jgi:hypothetical protein
MRPALGFIVIVTVIVTHLVVNPARAFAQEPGRLLVIVYLTDSKAHVTYAAVKKGLTITGTAGAPVYRVETGREGTIEMSLPPGVYLVESASPTPFRDRRYRWSTNVTVAPGAMVVLELNERNGQSTPIESAERGPFVAPFVQYGAPQRLAGGLSVLFPVGRPVLRDFALSARGLELQASGGQGGWRVAAGAFTAALPVWWADVLLTATRTTADPRGARPESTYLGVESGFALTLPFPPEWYTGDFIHPVIMIKPSFGFAHRLDGPAELKNTMFTWSTGAHVLLVKF